MPFGFLGVLFGHLGENKKGGGAAPPVDTDILLENSDPLLTEAGDFLVTES